jgi:hypothetical protein
MSMLGRNSAKASLLTKLLVEIDARTFRRYDFGEACTMRGV